MRKPALTILSLAAMLALALPVAAANKKKQAKESLNKTRATLEQVAEHLDEIAEDAGVDVRFDETVAKRKAGKKTSADRKKEKKEKVAKKFKKVRKLASDLHDHAKLLRTTLREAGAKNKAKRVKKIKRQLKELKTFLKQVDREKPENHLNELREAEQRAMGIQEAARKASDAKSTKSKVGRRIKEVLTGRPANRHEAAKNMVNNMKASVEEMRGISERLRHKDRSASLPRDPRVVLKQHAADLRSEADRLLEYWQGQNDNRRVKLARELIKRIGPVDKAVEKAPKNPGKKPKELDKLDSALYEVIDSHPQEVLELIAAATED